MNKYPLILPVEAYEHYETGAVDDYGFHVFAKRVKSEYTFPQIPDPVDPALFQSEKAALEAVSGGKNTLLFDDLGLPSVMVRIPMFFWSDVLEGAPEEPCSAFIINGKLHESIYISKYLNVVEHGRAYSLPGRNPASMFEIEEARAACAAKGSGWHLMSNAEWMALAHWSRKNGSEPRGNNNHGRDFFMKHEHAVRFDAGGFGQKHMYPTLTGTGPDSWSHDGTPFGVFDMNGNLWDLLSGFRLYEGEIQIIPDNDSAMNVDESPGSPLWRAIATDGSLVAPGSPGTYKYDSIDEGHSDNAFVNMPSGVKLSLQRLRSQYSGEEPDSIHHAYTMFEFTDLTHDESALPHMILKQLGMYPREGIRKTNFFMRNYGERVPARGGSWFDGPSAGVWELYMRENRTWIAQDIGFRCCWANIAAD